MSSPTDTQQHPPTGPTGPTHLPAGQPTATRLPADSTARLSGGSAARPSGGSTTRLHGLDALRGGALLLGIVLHALMPFLPQSTWMVVDSQPSALAGPIVFVIHLFRMVLFMMLAGYFGSMVLRRRGARRYLGDRSKRILLPAIVFWPVSVMSTWLISALNLSVRDLPPPPAAEDASLWLIFGPGVLWFLWTLMEALLIVVLVRAVLVRTVGAERLGRAARALGRLLSSPGAVLLPAVPYAVGLVLQGSINGGLREPLTLIPQGSSLVTYLGAFTTGWLLFAQRGSLQRLAGQWPAHLAAAVVGTAAAYLAVEQDVPLVAGAAILAVAGWCWVYALIGVCVRFLRRERPMVRYLADSSYWAYLLHLPILLLCELVIADLTWPMPVKLTLTLAVTTALLLSSYHLLVRPRALGAWLNGRRYPI
ncbi:acyltransferase family protein [Ruania zhangjianzhongii]|uniref:acyltransferase family protein n=1 Tax=Ruania zhangjianzhongii TaxID=2603206 RepID=UPI0011D1BBD1|nr:acyltransferase [Ruania zhangjianzhongii]